MDAATNDDDDDDDTVKGLSETLLSTLKVSSQTNVAPVSSPLILCDLGYGLPKEGRPRKEKILAISRQIVNFLEWQQQQQQQQLQQEASSSSKKKKKKLLPARLEIVGCNDADVKRALSERMHQLWKQQQSKTTAITKTFPSNLVFSDRPLESYYSSEDDDNNNNNPVYLSPDATQVLDTSKRPPQIVVVGLLIDRRRIQVHRSLHRASKLHFKAARWPLETVSDVVSMHRNEPLNVDTVLEGMQQWYWNCETMSTTTTTTTTTTTANQPITITTEEDCFQRAAIQALKHHQERHPARPKHKV